MTCTTEAGRRRGWDPRRGVDEASAEARRLTMAASARTHPNTVLWARNVTRLEAEKVQRRKLVEAAVKHGIVEFKFMKGFVPLRVLT